MRDHSLMQTLRKNAIFWQLLTLAAIGLTAFWPALQFDYVNWDDPSYIWFNDLIKSWSLSNLHGIATETVTRNYAPLTIATYLFDHTFWQMNPGGYHATNLLLHVLNGALVFLLVRQLTRNSIVAWTTAALFLVHPIQIETVVWISSRKGLLSGAFMLAALLVRTRQTQRPSDDAWYIGWLVAALLSKALAVVVPPIVMAFDILVRREKPSTAFVRQIIPGTLSLLLLLTTMGAQNTVLGGVRGHMDFPLWQILAVDVTILTRYIRMLFWPNDLCVLYDPATSGIWLPVLAGLAIWTTAAVLIWRCRKQQPLLLFGLASFFLLLFPVLNFFRITTLMNDRYLYLPCIIVFAMAAGGMYSLVDHLSRRWSTAPATWSRSTLLIGGVAATACAFCATTEHLPVWQNSTTLWAHTKQRLPHVAVVRIQTALTLYDGGNPQEAVRELQAALKECQPDAADRDRMDDMINEWSAELDQQLSATDTSTLR